MGHYLSETPQYYQDAIAGRASTTDKQVTDTKPDTADIFADAPPPTISLGGASHAMPAKRERSKDMSPMAQAKLAATQLRVLDARKGRALQACDKLRAEIEKLDEQRYQFILTLTEKVVDILKAGGAL